MGVFFFFFFPFYFLFYSLKNMSQLASSSALSILAHTLSGGHCKWIQMCVAKDHFPFVYSSLSLWRQKGFSSSLSVTTTKFYFPFTPPYFMPYRFLCTFEDYSLVFCYFSSKYVLSLFNNFIIGYAIYLLWPKYN